MKKKIDLLKIASTFNLLPFYIVGLFLIFLSLFFAQFYSHKKRTQFKEKHTFFYPQKDVLTKKEQLQKNTEFQIRACAHLRDFMELFFAYDKEDCQLKVEKALWLGDGSIEKIYKDFTNWFIAIEQNNLVTKILWENNPLDIEIGQKKNGAWPFKLRCVLQTSRPGINTVEKQQEKLTASGMLIEISKDFPLNPHGLLICDFSYFNAPLKKKAKK